MTVTIYSLTLSFAALFGKAIEINRIDQIPNWYRNVAIARL